MKMRGVPFSWILFQFDLKLIGIMEADIDLKISLGLQIS